jgi:hypothetical protein
MPANTKKLKVIQIPIGKIAKFKFYHRGLDDPIQEFWRFYETEFGFASKREFLYNIFLYHHENLQKFSRSGRNCFEGRNAANRYQVVPRAICRNCLTFNTFRNSISSSILRVSVCMPLRYKSNVCRSSRITSCHTWYTGGFALASIMYLSIQLFEIQILKGILALIQNPWDMRQTFNNESCPKSSILSGVFLDFSNTCSYFFWSLKLKFWL